MSKVHESLLSLGSTEPKWYLRTPDGIIRGPISLSTLCDWTVHGRVLPNHEVSNDNLHWANAEDIKELKMEWTAELPDGSKIGPFHVLTIPLLHKEGKLTTQARLHNRTTGKTLTVSELLKGKPKAATSPAPAPAPGTPPPPPCPAPAPDPTRKEWEQMYRDEKKQRLTREEELNSEISDLARKYEEARQDLASAQSATDQSEHELKLIQLDLRAKEQRSKDALLRAEGETRRLKEHAESLESELAKLRKEKIALIEAGAATGELARQLEDVTHHNLDAENRISELSRALQESEIKTQSAQADSEEQRTRLSSELDTLKTESEHKLFESGREIERLTVELQRMRGLHEEFEKTVPEHEAALMKEAREAQARAAAAEQELTRIRQSVDALRREAADKARQSDEQNAGLRRQVETSAVEIESLHAQLKMQTEAVASLESRTSTAESERDNVSVKDHQLQEHYDQLRAENCAQIEEIDKLGRTLDQERKSADEQRLKLEQEKAALAGALEESNQALSDYVRRIQATEQLAENTEKTAREQIVKETQERDQLRNQIRGLEEKLKQRAAENETMQSRLALDALSFEKQKTELENREKVLRQSLQGAEKSLEAERERLEGLLSQGRERERLLKEEMVALEQQTQGQESLLLQAKARIDESERAHKNTDLQLESDKSALQQTVAGYQQEINTLRKAAQDTANVTRKREEEWTTRLTMLNELLDTARNETRSAEEKGNSEIRRLQEALSTEQEAQREAQAESRKIEKELHKLREEYDACRKALEESENAARITKSTLASVQGELSEKNRALEQVREQSTRELKLLQSQQAELKKSLVAACESAQKENGSLHARAADLQARLQAAETALHAQKKEADSQIHQARIADRHRDEELAHLQTQLTEKQSALSKLEHQHDKLEGDFRTLSREKASLLEEAKDAVAQLRQTRRDLEKLSRKTQAQPVSANIPPAEKPAAVDISPVTDAMQSAAEWGKSVSPYRIVAGLAVIVCVCLAAVIVLRMDTGAEKKPGYATIAPPNPYDIASQAPVAEEKSAIRLENASVRSAGDEHTITFHSGLFANQTHWKGKEAIIALQEATAAIVPLLTTHTLVIEGHVDLSPDDAKDARTDAYAIGIARAESARQVIQDRIANLPSPILITSAGSENPPFIDKVDASSGRNRTVVLHLLPCEKSSDK